MWNDALRDYRARHQPPLSQEGLARRLRVSVRTVARIEAGLFQPSPMLQERLMKLGINNN